MISIFLMLVAMAFPLFEGWLILRILEGKMPVLHRAERFAWGWLVGGALSAFVIFWCVLLGVPVTFAGFVVLHSLFLIILAILAIPALKCEANVDNIVNLDNVDNLRPPPASHPWGLPHFIRPLPWLGKLLVAWMIVWTVVKVGVGGYDLLTTPSYFNDTHVNWNMRTKVFFTEHSLLLDRAPTDELFFGGRVASYPLTVYFTKLWAAFAAGEWSEPAVNGIHALWFLALLAALFSALRRETNLLVGLGGVAFLVSLPLVLVHGSNAYTDVLMGGHVFIAVYGLYRWAGERTKEFRAGSGQGTKDKGQGTKDKGQGTKDKGQGTKDAGASRSWLLLFAVSAAAMLFVKNEAMLIFLPPILLLFGALCVRWKCKEDFVRFIIPVLLIAVPWILFKLTHGLSFGNAQSIGGFSLSPQAKVPFAVESDLLYSGNYLLFFPLFALLLVLGWPLWKPPMPSDPKERPLGIMVLFLLIVFIGEFCMYWLTPLANEAIRHTGFGRGMVQLLPLGVFVSALILWWVFAEE